MRRVRYLRSSSSSSEKSQPSLLSLRRMQATAEGTSHCVSKTGSVIHVTRDDSNGHAVHHLEQSHTNCGFLQRERHKSRANEHKEFSDTHVQAETLPR